MENGPDIERVLGRIASVLDGYEAWGDDEDTTATIVRKNDETPLVRIHLCWPDDAMGIERLDTTLSPEEAYALALVYFWRDQGMRGDELVLVDTKTGQAHRIGLNEVSVRAAAPARAGKLEKAISSAIDLRADVSLSPRRSTAGGDRYDLTVRIAGPEDERVRGVVEHAIERLLDVDDDFELVEMDSVQLQFVE